MGAQLPQERMALVANQNPADEGNAVDARDSSWGQERSSPEQGEEQRGLNMDAAGVHQGLLLQECWPQVCRGHVLEGLVPDARKMALHQIEVLVLVAAGTPKPFRKAVILGGHYGAVGLQPLVEQPLLHDGQEYPGAVGEFCWSL